MSLLDNMKSLIDLFRNFSIDRFTEALRLVADTVDQSIDLFNAVVKPTFGSEESSAASGVAAMSDEALLSECEHHCNAKPEEGLSANPFLAMLFAELVKRLLDKFKK